jgi:2-polyprenyl-3-methyl-5-hydroxy-6-metoxy-1,4-benzoquinol methylase
VRRFLQGVRMRLAPPKGLFQPFAKTRLDRYPVTFRFVQRMLGADGRVRLLSFGCSTGEEVLSLRRYFANAAIKGIDINPAHIAVARKHADADMAFEVASSTAAEPDETYDAIFCMAVLRHGDLARPGVTRCDPLVRFEDFAATVAGFARCLRPGGLLVIRHSNFRLCDAPAGARFDTILQAPLRSARQTPIFGPDNALMPGAAYRDTVFRRRG